MLGALLWIGQQLELEFAILGFSDATPARSRNRAERNFATLNSIYAEYFGSHKPARTTVQVAALPKGAMLEIDLVAVV